MVKKRVGNDPLNWIKDSKQDEQNLDSVKDSKLELQIKTPQQGLKEGWIRATFIIKEEYSNKIKSLVYWDRKKVTVLMDEILENYFKDKQIKPIPGMKEVNIVLAGENVEKVKTLASQEKKATRTVVNEILTNYFKDKQ